MVVEFVLLLFMNGSELKEYTARDSMSACLKAKRMASRQLMPHISQTLGAEKLNTQDKIDRLYNAMIPLLNNLKKNPEKEYILWPDRLTKVEAFEDHLTKIYKS